MNTILEKLKKDLEHCKKDLESCENNGLDLSACFYGGAISRLKYAIALIELKEENENGQKI